MVEAAPGTLVADDDDVTVSRRARRSALVVAVGLGVAVLAAADLGVPVRDAAVLVATSFGVALVVHLGAGILVARWPSPMVVALVPVVALVLGSLAAARAMFVSNHDLSALVVVVAGAGTAGVLGALALAAELERSRRRVADLAAQERTAEAGRRELVAWVRHDLRTPIAGIRAMVEALDDGVVDDPAEVCRCHRQLVGEADRLAQLVDDLFELSRLEGGGLTPSGGITAGDLDRVFDLAYGGDDTVRNEGGGRRFTVRLPRD